MNYNIYLIGLERDILTQISSLLYTTFSNSDFVVTYTMRIPENPFPLTFLNSYYKGAKEKMVLNLSLTLMGHASPLIEISTFLMKKLA